jgi:hypothetical protein
MGNFNCTLKHFKNWQWKKNKHRVLIKKCNKKYRNRIPLPFYRTQVLEIIHIVYKIAQQNEIPMILECESSDKLDVCNLIIESKDFVMTIFRHVHLNLYLIIGLLNEKPMFIDSCERHELEHSILQRVASLPQTNIIAL